MAKETDARKPEIVAWLKPSCGWSKGVRAVLKKYGLEYEDRDVVNIPANYMEMVRVTGQRYQPSLMINGVTLPDISGEELEEWLIKTGLVDVSAEDAGAPIDRGCEDHSVPVQTIFRR